MADGVCMSLEGRQQDGGVLRVFQSRISPLAPPAAISVPSVEKAMCVDLRRSTQSRPAPACPPAVSQSTTRPAVSPVPNILPSGEKAIAVMRTAPVLSARGV